MKMSSRLNLKSKPFKYESSISAPVIVSSRYHTNRPARTITSRRQCFQSQLSGFDIVQLFVIHSVQPFEDVGTFVELSKFETTFIMYYVLFRNLLICISNIHEV